MRIVTAAFALALGTSALGTASAAEGGFSDAICPEATQYVLAVGRARRDDPAQKRYDVAQAAVDAYSRCSKDKLANGFREPQHYADTRGAAFAVLAARAMIELGRLDDARRELLQYRALAQQVVDWDSETETTHTAVGGGGTGDSGASMHGAVKNDNGAKSRRPSVYRNSAKDIVLAADAELSRITDLSHDAPHAQPAPAASPGH